VLGTPTNVWSEARRAPSPGRTDPTYLAVLAIALGPEHTIPDVQKGTTPPKERERLVRGNEERDSATFAHLQVRFCS